MPRFIALGLLCSGVLLGFAAPLAHADSLPNLSAATQTTCPACTTAAGGADVVNLSMKMVESVGRTADYTPPDTPPRPDTPLWGAYLALVGGSAGAGAGSAVVASAVDATAATGVLGSSVGIGGAVALGAGAGVVGVGVGLVGYWFIGQIRGGNGAPASSPGMPTITSQYMDWKWQTGTDNWASIASDWGMGCSGPYQASALCGTYGRPGVWRYRWSQSDGLNSGTNLTLAHQWTPAWPYQKGPGSAPAGFRTLVVTNDGTGQLDSTPGAFRVYYKTYGDALSETGLTPSNSLPSGYAPITPGPPPTRAQVAAAMAKELNDNEVFAKWVQHVLSPRCNADPTESTVLVPAPLPNETASDYYLCVLRLGLEPYDLRTADWAARPDLPPGTVLAVNHAGERVASGSSIRALANSDPLPSPIPAPPATQSSPSCDINPRGEDPLPGAPKYDAWIGSPVDPNHPANFLTSDGAPTFLLKGTVDMLDPDMTGFGFRHIYAKHGWGSVEEAETREALAVDLTPTSDGSRYKYQGVDVTFRGPGKLWPCIRVVVIDRDRGFDQPLEHDSAGIITSYGQDASRA